MIMMSGHPSAYAQLRANVGRHPLVYGAAIAFEAHQYKPGRRLFSPYVYQEGETLSQMDIADGGYDYTDPQWTWWHWPRERGRGVWTDPYFDYAAMTTWQKQSERFADG